MIIALKENYDPAKLNILLAELERRSIETRLNIGDRFAVLELFGDVFMLDTDRLKRLDIVSDVMITQNVYLKSGKNVCADNTIIDVGGLKIGADELIIIAGPCAIESRDQIMQIAERAKENGADILRGGAFKPRTSPYSFQGLGPEGIDLLLEAKRRYSIPVISEITEISQLDLFSDIDIIQIGAKNMQNYELLKEIGKTKKPTLLKRGPSNSIQELLMSAEYIMAGGNSNVILCERGIRTFETVTRHTMDISAIPVVKELSHLPIIADPSHGTGVARLVKPMAYSAVAAGADGLIIETHPSPSDALCDGMQAVTPSELKSIVAEVKALYPYAYGK